MPIYQIAVAHGGRSLELGVADSASDAVVMLQRAQDQYGRVWVTDEDGTDLSIAELLIRSNEERRPGRDTPR